MHPTFPSQVWGRGRVTLVGDAAHMSTPFLAQGTSQAFEDALALGRAIGEPAGVHWGRAAMLGRAGQGNDAMIAYTCWLLCGRSCI